MQAAPQGGHANGGAGGSEGAGKPRGRVKAESKKRLDAPAEAPAEEVGCKLRRVLPPDGWLPAAGWAMPTPSGAHCHTVEAIIQAILEGGGDWALDLALRAPVPLHELGDVNGLSVIHAAACTSAGAGVLALALRQASKGGVAVVDMRSGPTTSTSKLSKPLAWAQEFSTPVNLDSDALPLDFAALHGCVEAVSLLLRSGADPNKRAPKSSNRRMASPPWTSPPPMGPPAPHQPGQGQPQGPRRD